MVGNFIYLVLTYSKSIPNITLKTFTNSFLIKYINSKKRVELSTLFTILVCTVHYKKTPFKYMITLYYIVIIVNQ